MGQRGVGTPPRFSDSGRRGLYFKDSSRDVTLSGDLSNGQHLCVGLPQWSLSPEPKPTSPRTGLRIHSRRLGVTSVVEDFGE